MARVGIRKSAAQALLNEYKEKIISIIDAEDTVFEEIKSNLRNIQQRVNDITQQAFAALGYNKDIASNEKNLQTNVQEAISTISALHGDHLGKTFIQKFIDANPFEYNIQKKYDKLLNFLREEAGSNDYSKIAKVFAEQVLEREFYKLDERTGIIRVRQQGSSKTTLGGNLMDAFAELGPKTKKKVLEFLDKHQEFLKTSYSLTIDQERNSFIHTVQVASPEIFLKMSPEERKPLLQLYPEILTTINTNYTEAIVEECEKTGADIPLLRECIQEVLSKTKDLAFFVGGNSEQLTGVLGEIQGLYVFRKIVQKNNINSTIDWVGGIKNPHADLLLTSALDTFGIQVKNTSWDRAKDQLYEIEFKDINLSAKGGKLAKNDIFSTEMTSNASQYVRQLGLSKDIFNAIQDALAARTFNVKYLWTEGHAVEVDDNKDFNAVRDEIEYYALRAEAIMGLFSAALMYMQSTEIKPDKQKTYANSLYLVGGATVVSAATILAEIMKEVEAIIKNELESFSHFHSYVKSGHHEQKTIVDFFNNDKGREHHADIMSFTLQSSYNF